MYGFQFDSLAAFFAMGGHGPYVWAAYGMGLLVMAWLVIRPWLQKRRFLTRFDRSRYSSSPGEVATEGNEVS